MRTDQPHFKVFLLSLPGMGLWFPYDQYAAFQVALQAAHSLPLEAEAGARPRPTWYYGPDIFGCLTHLDVNLVAVVQACPADALAALDEYHAEYKARSVTGGF